MPRELLHLLPHDLLRLSTVNAGLCAGLGLILWVCGARFSRSILTLVAVTVGTVVGMRLPEWRGWQIDGMGLAVGAAIGLGSCAFLFHRTCIGVILGAGMMAWAGTAVWIFLGGDVYWDWQSVHWQGDMVQFTRDAWRALPPTLSHSFPVACFLGLAGGITLAVYLPKFSKVLAHSLTGVTLMTVMGSLAIVVTGHGDWLKSVPGSLPVQGMAMVGWVLLGVLVQWRITPPYRQPPSNGAKKS
ncbi:MAG TPA: hypothetical protein VLJ39_14250 [Tepidisphaeraceae bacterium]|nr:hypothetical protein [Tepidisphaeraceae bacterium]